MVVLSEETVALAERLATAQRLPVEDAVRHALEEKARAAGVLAPRRRRMSAAAMLAVGDEIAAMPLLDHRTPREIMDDLNTP